MENNKQRAEQQQFLPTDTVADFPQHLTVQKTRILRVFI